MRKIIPIMVIIAFLVASIFNIFLSLNGNLEVQPIENQGNLDLLMPAGPSDEIDKMAEPVELQTIEPVTIGGSRVKITTRTSISLDSPTSFEEFLYEDEIKVSGHLFEDNNSNGIFDAGEDIPVPLAKVNINFGDNLVDVDTDEDGLFEWSTTNLLTVKGERDLQINYYGQYTLNGTHWFDVDLEKGGKLGFNDDDDYYIDCEIWENMSSNYWEYNFPGNGKWDPGDIPTPGNTSRVMGLDVHIRDTGSRKGTWDSGDEIIYDPLASGQWMPATQTISSWYTPPGQPHSLLGFRVDFTDPLIDEEWPNSFDQSQLPGFWADDDGDWDVTTDDIGIDGSPGTSDPGEGDNLPNPGEPNVDEDINFTKFRQPSNMTLFISLWHDTEVDAVILNSTGKQTNKAVVGETITIKGTLRNKINPSLRPQNKNLKLKIFGNFIQNTILTDTKGEFSFDYIVPTDTSLRVGQRDIDIIFDDRFYDPDYNLTNKTHEFFKPTSLATQDSGPLTLRIYRPIHIEFEKPNYVGYLYKSISINGTLKDDKNRALATSIVNDDGSSEVLTVNAYKLIFEWGRDPLIDRYYDTLELDLLDPSGNFTIPKYEIIDPHQELGDINFKVSVMCNSSQTYYLDTYQSNTATVRSKASLDLWIDQDNDGNYNEEHATKIGPLADYITRKEFIDNEGNTKEFNRVVVYGRLAQKERDDEGLDNKIVQYYWEDEYSSFEESEKTTITTTKDFNLNGRIEDTEEGRFAIPDPNNIQEHVKYIEKSHPLGPITIHVKYEDLGDYIDPVTMKKDFNVVAMTKIVITPGSGIKGENITINGRLIDDLSPPTGVAKQDINLYWEDLPGDLLVDDKYDPVKLAGAKIGNVTTDSLGYFSFYSEEILKRDVDVGKGYVVAIFEGSGPYIGTNSKEIPFNVSAYTRVDIDEPYKNQKLIRGRSFQLEGSVVEKYKGDKNPDSKVLLTIADAGQMEIYIRNLKELNATEYTQISDITVEYKSEGKFSLSGTVPFNLDVGQAQLQLVFKGSKDGKYIGDDVTTGSEIWADTIIKILSPEVRKKEIESEGYVLAEDIEQALYDEGSGKYNGEGLIFRFQLLELTVSGEPKPVESGEIKLTINSSYSVFRNFSKGTTDIDGYIEFTFNSPLRDTDWGYTLARTDPEELIITVEFSGKPGYLSSKTLPIQTTHWPPEKDDPISTTEVLMGYLWFIVPAIIILLVVVAVAYRWYSKQQRIRGMRRIIKRAADQLIAGNEYQAVIFKSYQKLGVHLRKYGYLRRESETFREFEGAVRSALPIDRMSMDSFLHLLEEARYSSHQIGENQRNDAVINLRSIEKSLDRIIIDEDAAVRALERLETEGVKDTKIIVGKPQAKTENVPQLLRRPTPPKPKAPGPA